MHRISHNESSVAAATGFDAAMEHLDQLIKLIPRQFAIGIGAAQHGVKRILIPGFSGAGSDNLLHQNVEWLRWNFQSIQIASTHCLHQRGAFNQVIAGGGEETSLGNCASPVACAANPLHSRCNRARGSHLAHKIDRADINTQFERCGGDKQFDFAILESCFRVQTQLARKAAMMRGHILRADALTDGMREPFDHATRIHKHQRRTMLLCKRGQTIVGLVPHGIRRH